MLDAPRNLLKNVAFFFVQSSDATLCGGRNLVVISEGFVLSPANRFNEAMGSSNSIVMFSESKGLILVIKSL